MKNIIHLNGKQYSIKPFLTKDELDVLEFLFTNDNLSYNEYVSVLDEFLEKQNINTDIPVLEKICLLLKVREITIGNEINVKATCSKCKKPFDNKIFINKIISTAKMHDENIHALVNLNNIDNLKLEDIAPEEYIDNLDYDEYLNISANIKNYVDTYNFKYMLKCSYCSEKTEIILTLDKIISFISEEDFGSLSKIIHLLCYYEHLSRSDVLNMTPIQRVLELNYLQETQKNIADTKNKNDNQLQF